MSFIISMVGRLLNFFVLSKFDINFPMSDFGQAENQFERILAIDQYRVDDIDIFSNILYVTENKLKLSRLAHEFLALDKDRPEVCCLVGRLLENNESSA